MASFLQALFGGGEAPNLPYNPPQMPERFLNPSPVPEMQINKVRQGLVGAKLDYDTADKSTQWWTKQLDTPDLTDEQKQQINSNIEGWSRKRDAAAQSAIDMRNQADAMGIDVSDYGSDKTLQEASQAYNTYRNTATRDFLRLPSVRELEESRYIELRNSGASPRQAERILGRERAGRQEDFLKRVTEGVMTYGVNPDGQTLNHFGLSMMQKLDPANPELVGKLFAGGFAMPKDIFSEDRADNRVRMTNDAAAQRQAEQILANWKNAEAQRNATRSNLEYTVTNQNEQNELQRDLQWKIANLTKTAKQMGVAEDKLAAEVESLVNMGIPREKALELVVRQKYNHAFAGLKDDNTKLSDGDKFENFVGGQFKMIEYYLETKDYKTAKELIEQFRTSIRNPENKYSELAGADATEILLKQLQMYDEVAAGKRTLQQLRELQRDQWRPGVAGFRRGEDMNQDENENAKKIGEEAAIKERQRKDMWTFWNYPWPQVTDSGVFDPHYGYVPHLR